MKKIMTKSKEILKNTQNSLPDKVSDEKSAPILKTLKLQAFLNDFVKILEKTYKFSIFHVTLMLK